MIRSMFSGRFIGLVALLAGAGCGDGPAPLADAGVPSDPWTGAEVSCDRDDVRVVRVLPWSGGGVQIVADSPAESLSVTDSDGGLLDSEVAPVGGGAGVTALLVVPAADPAIQDARLAAASAVIDGLPAGERIALLEAPVDPGDDAGTAAGLMSDLTRDREELHRRLDAIAPATDRRVGPALPELEATLAVVEGSFGAIHRDLVIVGDAPDAAPPGGFQPVELSWLDEQGEGLDPDTGYAGWAGDRTARLAATEVVDSIAARRAARRRIGVCPPSGEWPLLLRAGATTCQVARPSPMAHLAAQRCDPSAAAADRFPYPATVGLTFTDAERAVYDDRYANNSKQEFDTRVTLGAGVPIDARAHFRGQTSLGCARKSMFVDLAGSAPRRLLPRVASDRFLLISMCKDTGYFGQAFGDRLLAASELFQLGFGFVVLYLDGVDQGVYLLLEHPDRALMGDLLRGAAVIRRRFDPDGVPVEVEVPTEPDKAEAARQHYLAAVALAESGPIEDLDQRLDQLIDLDGYLRWLALASLLENGDYVDELLLYGSAEPDTLWLRSNGWDTDDLFEACHHQGIWALHDPCDLLYCAEGDLDQAVIRSPAVYRRFGAILAEQLDGLPAATLADTMATVREQLFAALADDQTAAAMVELIADHPEATTAVAARAVIETEMADMLDAAAARRALLRSRLDACAELAQ